MSLNIGTAFHKLTRLQRLIEEIYRERSQTWKSTFAVVNFIKSDHHHYIVATIIILSAHV